MLVTIEQLSSSLLVSATMVCCAPPGFMGQLQTMHALAKVLGVLWYSAMLPIPVLAIKTCARRVAF
eukprot:2286750-Amphidinium_carterae.1